MKCKKCDRRIKKNAKDGLCKYCQQRKEQEWDAMYK